MTSTTTSRAPLLTRALESDDDAATSDAGRGGEDTCLRAGRSGRTPAPHTAAPHHTPAHLARVAKRKALDARREARAAGDGCGCGNKRRQRRRRLKGGGDLSSASSAKVFGVGFDRVTKKESIKRLGTSSRARACMHPRSSLILNSVLSVLVFLIFKAPSATDTRLGTAGRCNAAGSTWLRMKLPPLDCI